MRIVKMTDEQFEELSKGRVCHEGMARVLGNAIFEAAKRMSEEDDNYWQSIGEMVGEKDGSNVEINWLSREFKVHEDESFKDGK